MVFAAFGTVTVVGDGLDAHEVGCSYGRIAACVVERIALHIDCPDVLVQCRDLIERGSAGHDGGA